jgi:hypothetical protein
MLILASIYGMLGVFIGCLFIIAYAVSFTSNGIPYTAFRIKREEDKE